VTRVLLVDDEMLARERLREMLGSFPDLEVVGEAADGEEAIDRIVALRPDVVFLDVQMPGCSGLEVARSLGSPEPRIVFCTSFDEYAVAAFELSAADYLLKPVTRARLAQTVERVRRAGLPEWEAARERATRPSAGRTRFLARCAARFRVVPQEEVLCFSSEEGLTALVTARERHWMEPTLNELESRLDPAVFFRVSRAAIVRLDAIAEVVPLVGGHGELLLRNGSRVPVSRRRLRELLLRIEGRSERP
jgi:two-component system, LytTR family, response regulator